MQHLKLHSHKGLKTATLENLEQFNVVCGRNNNGKTTLLECIADENKRVLGAMIPQTESERLGPIAVAGMGWGRTDPSASENVLFKRLLDQFLKESKGRIWYTDEADAFAQELRRRFDASSLQRWVFAEASSKRAFLSCFPAQPRSVFVPSQRNLETQIGVNSSQPVADSGTGLVNYLFRAKNLPITSIDNKVWQTISEAFLEISAGCRFDIFIQEANSLRLYFADPGRSWIPADSCGLGLQDLLVILSHCLLPGRNLIVIEEPETHMHPDLQRRLAIYLKSLSDLQFVISTHSNVFLGSALVDKVIFVSYEDEVKVADATGRAAALDSLGYQISDNLVSDLIILMEGPTDRPAIEQMLIKTGIMQKKNIKFWPLGGDIMDQLDLEVFAQGSKIIAVVDKDPRSGSVRKRFMDNCKDHHIKVYRLKRYSIENYFPIETYRSVFGAQVPAELTSIDPDIRVEKQLGFSPKKKLWNLAKSMDLMAIEGTDLLDFLEEVKRLCGV